MSAADKSRGGVAYQIETLIATFVAEYTKGGERVAEFTRQALDVASQHNTEAAAAWKKGADVASEAFQRSLQAQKELLEIGAERGRVASRLATENIESITKAAAGVGIVFETLAGHVASVHQRAVEFAATQNATVVAAATRQFEASRTAAAEAFQRGVETLVEAQRVVVKAQEAA